MATAPWRAATITEAESAAVRNMVDMPKKIVSHPKRLNLSTQFPKVEIESLQQGSGLEAEVRPAGRRKRAGVAGRKRGLHACSSILTAAQRSRSVSCGTDRDFDGCAQRPVSKASTRGSLATMGDIDAAGAGRVGILIKSIVREVVAGCAEAGNFVDEVLAAFMVGRSALTTQSHPHRTRALYRHRSAGPGRQALCPLPQSAVAVAMASLQPASPLWRRLRRVRWHCWTHAINFRSQVKAVVLDPTTEFKSEAELTEDVIGGLVEVCRSCYDNSHARPCCDCRVVVDDWVVKRQSTMDLGLDVLNVLTPARYPPAGVHHAAAGHGERPPVDVQTPSAL